MGTRVFAEQGKFKLHGDDRDVAVSCLRRNDVWGWCEENDIYIEYQDTQIGNSFGIDIWRIRDEQQRITFLLKWGHEDRC